MLNEISTDVLIVGGGIGGATLALALGKQGHKVIIIERLKKYPNIYKGEFLQPATLKLLNDLEVLSAIKVHCVPVTKMTYGKMGGDDFFTAKYTDLNSTFKSGLNGDHNNIRFEILREIEHLPNVSIIKETNAVKVIFDDNNQVIGLEATSPQGKLLFKSKILVGADGVKSTIRNQLPIQFKLRSLGDLQGKIAAITLHLNCEPKDEVSFYFGKAVGCGSFPLPNKRVRIYLSMRNNKWDLMRKQGINAFIKQIKDCYPDYSEELSQIDSFKDIQVIPSYFLRCEKWAVNGAVLLGDSCHAVSPSLGQGMNLAIQGAMELNRTINNALEKNCFSEELLRHYEYKRKNIVKLIQSTSSMHTYCWMNNNIFFQVIRNLLFKRAGKCYSIPKTQLEIVAGFRDKMPPISQVFRLLGLLPAK